MPEADVTLSGATTDELVAELMLRFDEMDAGARLAVFREMGDDYCLRCGREHPGRVCRCLEVN